MISSAFVFAGCRANARKPHDHAPTHKGVRFKDVATQAGIDYQWPTLPRPLTIRDSFGTGCGFIDYDQDGLLDVLLVGSPRCGLFRNLGKGQFEDVTESAGLASMSGPWIGCASGDYNADGWPDLYITGFHAGRLLRNDQGRRFVDASSALEGFRHGWESSAGFADLDADGDEDLFIGNYVVYGPGSLQYCELAPGIQSGCPPSRYEPEKGRLLRNDGGRFVEISDAAGIRKAYGKNLALGFVDYDRDGALDLYVANDGLPGNLFRNVGNLRFENVGVKTGSALSPEGRAQAGMGVAWADFDRDGWQDLIVTTFSGEAYSLYRNTQGYFDVQSRTVGLEIPTRQSLGFGVQWIDADNNGWRDLVFANGHVYDNTSQIEPGTTFEQAPMLFLNREGARFEDAGPNAGPPFQTPIVARGLASGDYDADGRVDLLIATLEGRPLLLHNESETGHHWLRVRLRANSRAPVGDGAVVSVTTAQGAQHACAARASSYLSTNEAVVHFGLGRETSVLRVEVTWPGGQRQQISDIEADVEIMVSQPPKGGR